TIALALTRYISRPIAEIDAAIRQLGGADFSRPIAVRGPEDLRYLGRRLDWLRRRLDEFETQKNRFLRHVSHELKTPLTALREGAELLHDQVAGPLAPPQRQVVAIMRDNSVKLQGLIEELESIFNLFFRGRTKADTGVKGSGLGLAIARELVEAHGGQIAVVAGGAGGHFRVTLPRRGERRAYS